MKDALNHTFFKSIDEMLLRLYYLYEKSPKKCRELEGIVTDLKECFESDEGGIRPVRASGTRWVSHKLSAMKRILSKYGAYITHLTTLTEDTSVKPADRAKLTGYVKKWLDAKYLLRCAVFIDLLTPCAIFSKTMQFISLDTLGTLMSLLQTVKSTNKLSSASLQHWPTYSSMLRKINEEKGKFSYQCQVLKNFSEAKCYYENQYSEYCVQVIDCIKSRLAWSDLTTIRDIIFILATNGWQKPIEEAKSVVEIDFEETVENENSIESECIVIDRLIEKFRIPLEGANADTAEILPEFKMMVAYASQFISLSTLDYKSVWWQLFNAPNSSEWSNALILIKLLFSLPVSNGTVERIFSNLNVIKTDR